MSNDYKCWYCRKYDEGKLVCSTCQALVDANKLNNKSVPYCQEKVKLEYYGYASKAQLGEMERRVIIKHNPDGSYILGRRGENGKIQERHPDYR